MAVNGDKNIVYLSKMNGTSFNFDKFYIGQPIYLSSNVYPTPELRLIKKISIVPVSEDVILEVEGKLDLDKYTISDGAMIKVYKKYTTNSNYFILIPTDNVPQNEMINRDELPWFLRIKEDDEIQQRVDLYLNEDKDIEISNSNDLMLSYGINNAIQALMLKFTVEAGELMRHPQFGFVGDVIGAKNINVASNRQRIVDYITSQISSDDRFDSIVSLDVQTFNNYYVINLVVRLSGGLNKIVPVSFKIPIK
jgi:heat shock protein HspQ